MPDEPDEPQRTYREQIAHHVATASGSSDLHLRQEHLILALVCAVLDVSDAIRENT